MAHFIKPWTQPILEKNLISWSEFEAKFRGSDEPAENDLLHRKTNPVHFVNMLRDGELKGRCATGFFTASNVYFVNATRLQVVNRVRKENASNMSEKMVCAAAACLHSSPASGCGTARTATACRPTAAAKLMALPPGTSQSYGRSSTRCRAQAPATTSGCRSCVTARVALPQVQ